MPLFPSRLMRRSLTLLLGLCAAVSANDRHFGYVHETATMPVGAREVEVWTTARAVHDTYYSRLDHRVELETGLTDNLQGAFYLNWRNITAREAAGLKSVTEWQGVSTELKYKFSDPVADVVGFGLYGELGYSTDAVELEAKALFDKRVGPLLLAANFVGELEYEAEGEEFELEEIGLEGVFGASYALSRKLSLGLEFRSHNEIVEGELEAAALFLGPTAAYSSGNWWMTFTVLPQIAALKHEGGGLRDLEDHEALEARLLLSFHL
jgi:hypothetical protein